MSYCIRFGSRTDIASLNITDHNKALFLAVINCLLKCDHSGDTELLIHSYLRLYCRNQIINGIHNSLIILPDCFSCALQGLAKFSEGFLADVLRNEFHHRIQTYHDGGIRLLDLLYQFVDHNLPPLFLMILTSLYFTTFKKQINSFLILRRKNQGVAFAQRLGNAHDLGYYTKTSLFWSTYFLILEALIYFLYLFSSASTVR